MRVRYDRDEDILLIEVMPEGRVDHAEHVDSIIVHLTADGRLVLLEIMDASRFLARVLQAALRGEEMPA